MSSSGVCVASYNVWLSVPLSKAFCPTCRCKANKEMLEYPSLPKYSTVENHSVTTTVTNPMTCEPTIMSSTCSNHRVYDLIHKIQCQDPPKPSVQDNELMRAAIIVALILQEDPVKYLHWKTVAAAWQTPSSNQEDAEVEADELCTAIAQSSYYAATTMHGDETSRQDRFNLVYNLYQRMHIVHVEHPMVQYGKTVVPQLTKSELAIVAATLNLPHQKDRDGDVSVLRVSKEIQDRYQTLSRAYAILLDPSESPLSLQYTQSCIPTAQVEYNQQNNNNTLVVTALYKNNTKHVTLSYVPVDGHVEDRERYVTLKLGSSCACIRCRFEVCNKDVTCLPVDLKISYTSTTAIAAAEETIRLGHWYMGNQQLETAERIYRYILRVLEDDNAVVIKEEDEMTLVLDVWHALGAIALTRGEFLNARNIWKEAAEKYDVSKHKELSTILDKIRSYPIERKREHTSSTITTTTLSWKSPIPGVHVTQVLDKEACERVIQLANEGTWTRERHYAVPTNDVPVHTVKPLLDWFNQFFEQRVCPLLAKQFQSTTDFFVNDAFCVRYQASEISNHLPIHTDESSHSFVLALNDDYEGGGTYFWGTHEILRLRAGELMSFQGGQLEHGGEAVKSGTRYILAVFLYYNTNSNTDRDDRSQDISPENLDRKRRETSLGQQEVGHDPKRQKSGFSFGFICD